MTELISQSMVVEPRDDKTPWRYVGRDGKTYKYTEKQLALAQHVATHACLVKDSADAVGMNHTSASSALSKQHVKALVMHLMGSEAMSLKAGALSVLRSALVSDELDMAQKSELALRLIDKLGGYGEEFRATNNSGSTQGGASGVSVNISLPHGASGAKGGVVIGPDGSVETENSKAL